MKRNDQSKISVKMRGAAALLTVFLFLSAAFGQKTSATIYENGYSLKANERVERRINKDEKHLYKINLKRGELLHIRVEQRGIDVVTAIAKSDEAGKVLLKTDHAPTADGTESFVFMAETSGEYIFGVFGFEAVSKDSGYVLQNTAPLEIVEEKQFAAADLENLGTAAYKENNYPTAIFYHENALKLREDLPASPELALLYFHLGGDFYDSGNFEKSVEFYQKTAPIYRQLGDKANAAISLYNIGGGYSNLKNYEKSTVYYRQALPLLREVKNQDIEKNTLENIAQNYLNLKDYVNSTAFYEQKLALARELKDSDGEKATLGAIAGNYFLAADYEKAFDFYQRQLSLYRQSKEEENEAATLFNVGLTLTGMQKQVSAVAYFQQSLEINRRRKDTANEVRSLMMLGDNYADFGENATAIPFYEEALKISREAKDRLMEMYSLRGLGLANSYSGEYETSLKYHLEAQKIARELNNELEEAYDLINIGLIKAETGSYDESNEFNQKALAVFIKVQNRDGERAAINNLGVNLLWLGSLKRAEANFQKVNDISVELKDRRTIARALANLGAVKTRLKEYEAAIKYFEESLPMLNEFKDNRFAVVTYTYYGTIRRERGELEKAVALHIQAAELARTAQTPKFQARALVELGLDYLAQNNLELCAATFEKALNYSRIVKSRDEEAASLDGLMKVWNRRGQKALAIFYGKQSINILQATRTEIRKLDKEVQANFVKDNEQTYRQLAETLVAEGRIPEAQQVLAMLKEEELSGFVRRDAKEIENLSKRADLRADEKSALERYNSFSSKVTEIGAELAKLEDVKKRLAAGENYTEQARLDELTAQLKDANTAFRIFLEKELIQELGKDRKKEITDDRALQGKLKQWGAGTVAVLTMLGEDRYRVILTTPNAQIDGKTEIKAADLNAKIFAFREALLNPMIDPRPLGKELYDILIKPIEKDLDAAGAKTILWSLDGTLRYVPIAALWDGKQYILQKYQTVVITSTTRQSLQAEVNKNWRVLGAGVTKASEITDTNTAQKFSFDELKSVGKELAAVLESGKSSKGDSAGVSLLDTTFTENALKQELTQMTGDERAFNVVHFATHFRLGSDTADSFLLLGNNKALTLAEVADSPEMNLTDVELVTLSACNTGFGGLGDSRTLTENNGKEVDSLAQFIELRGAKSVMATLWSVADESTAILMGEFYRLRRGNQVWSKAETLRQAQLELLNGKYTPEQITERNRSEAVRFGKSAKDMPKFVKDENAPFAHPFYWSPFVLIGNWR